MIRKITLALSLLLALPGQAEPFGPILRVVDGDTYVIAAPWLPPVLGDSLSLRVFGIDTPEHGSRAQCQREAVLSDQGIAFVKDTLGKSKKIVVVIKQWDKYGGRVDGLVLVDGKSLGGLLISAGFARAYFGEKKTSWCN